MSQDADTTVEDALLLELAQLGMDMARRVHEAACATTDVEPLVALMNAFHQMSRGSANRWRSAPASPPEPS